MTLSKVPRGKRWSRRLVLQAGLATALPLPLPAYANAEAGAVEAASGRTWAEPDRMLAAAAPVFVGDLVKTGAEARLALMLGGVTRILMGPEASLTIDRFTAEAGGELILGDGALLFDRPEDAPKTNVALQSAFGLIAVRGTRFFAGPSNGVFGVFVERGVVRVSGAGVEVEVTPGLGTNIDAPGAAPSAPAPWGQARIEAALALVGAA